jgi:peptidoglycan hydrolase-like protein with peptidoglycan-binding domain
MIQHRRRSSGTAAGSPGAAVSTQPTSVAPLDSEATPATSNAASPLMSALEACFGATVHDIDLTDGGPTLSNLGADAATENGEVLLPSSLDLEHPDAEEADTVGHEVAHALGTTSGSKTVDEPDDSSERDAERAGQTFSAWFTRGAQGPAPRLAGASGGKGKIQRKGGDIALTGSPALQEGDRGGRVVRLQQLLNDRGFNLGVDGIFGNATDRAVKTFQKRQGLEVDGIVGPKTAAALQTAYQAPDRKPGGKPADDQPGAPVLTGDPPLKRGERSPRVRVLQDLLGRAGHRLGIDGDFGDSTDRAVRAYQRSRGLEVDGIVGKKTAAALSTNAPAIARDESPPEEASEERRSFDPGGRLANSKMNPAVVSLTERVCLELQRRGYHPYVVSGFRSFAEQDALYEQGRTKPGQKVTWVKGGGSWHNYGLAVDIAFWNSGGTGPSWASHHPWHLIGEVGLAQGFTRWGGDFGDRPHLEHHPAWGSSTRGLAAVYQEEGLPAVWKKVGAG